MHLWEFLPVDRLHASHLAAGVQVAHGMNETEYNYQLQVWVVNGIIQPCEHPASMRITGPCCPANRYWGLTIAQVRNGSVVGA